MTLLEPQTHHFILIQSFAVEPRKEKAVQDLLLELGREWLRPQAGFLSSHLHRSLDGARIVNYAVWEDEASYRGTAFRLHQQSSSQDLLGELRRVAGEERHLYRLVCTLPDEADPTLSEEGPLATVQFLQAQPGRQLEVMEALKKRAAFHLARRSGFLNASLHCGIDGIHLVSYVQWESAEAYDGALQLARESRVSAHEAVLHSEARLYQIVASVEKKESGQRKRGVSPAVATRKRVDQKLNSPAPRRTL